MTNYYHIRMDDFSEHWDTNKIIEFLNESNKFTYNGKSAIIILQNIITSKAHKSK